MSSLQNVEVTRTDSGRIRVTGKKGSGLPGQVFLNGVFKEALRAVATDFDVTVSVDGTPPPHTIKIVLTDGRTSSIAKDEEYAVLVS